MQLSSMSDIRYRLQVALNEQEVRQTAYSHEVILKMKKSQLNNRINVWCLQDILIILFLSSCMMQIICLFSIVQFHLMINCLTFLGFQISEVDKNDGKTYLLLIGVVHFITQLSLLIIIVLRPKFSTNKKYIISLFSLGVVLSVVLISLNFSQYVLVLVILQLLSTCLINSFLAIPKEKIAIGIIIQIYTIGVAINFTPFYLWQADMFSLGRAIAISGSTAIGLITFALCMLCQLKPCHSVAEQLHIIMGFYFFCEIFTCSMFVTEASDYYQQSDVHFNQPIVFTLLKISNLLLDILIYPFSKHKQNDDKGTISRVIPDRFYIMQGRSDAFVVTTNTESECGSVIKITPCQDTKPKKQTNPTQKWIQRLLEIY